MALLVENQNPDPYPTWEHLKKEEGWPEGPGEGEGKAEVSF